MVPTRKPKRVRVAIAALLALLLLGIASTLYLSSLDAAWWRATRLVAENQSWRRSVPRDGQENESDVIQARAQSEFDRLAYPARSIPASWQTAAQAHVRRAVRDGTDFLQAGRAQPSGTRPPNSVSWTSMGPAPIDNDAASDGYKYGLVTGRINALAADPSNPQVVYAGSTAGGLWKTTNCCSASTVWLPLWEGKDFVSQAVSAIAIDPSNPQVIYAGTGDADAGDQFSSGIMKSTDGGATWQQFGATIFTPYAAGTPSEIDQSVSAIVIDPRNTSTIAAGTRYGFYLSRDGGKNWTRYAIHGHDEQSQRVSSLLLDASSNPSTIYVAVGFPYASQREGNIGGGNGVYKASIPTSGAPSFALLSNGWPASTGTGTANDVGRIRLASSAQNPQIIYAQVGDYNNFNALGTWVTKNGGASWTQLAGSGNIDYHDCANVPTSEGQDWYDLAIGVDSSNDHVLYVGRTSMYRLQVNSDYTGITSITNLANVYSQSCAGYGSIHPDQHALAMLGGGQVLVGNDGGVYLGNGAVGGFTQLNRGLNISQFYAGQIGANFATSSTQFAFGGMQDNGSASWDAANPTAQWQARGNGGDGFFAAFDPLSSTKTQGNWYTEYTYGALSCSTTGAQGPFFSTCTGGWYSPFGFQIDRSDWSTPFVLDQFHCSNAKCSNIMLGTNRLWASGSGGTSRSSWLPVSTDLTKGDIWNDGASNTIIDARFAPSSPTSAVVGTDDGNVQWSNNIFGGPNCTAAAADTASFSCAPVSGATWVNLAKGNAVLPNRAIQGVAFDPSDDRVIYAAVGGFNANTPSTPGHLFQAKCSANCASASSWSWADKTANLPDVPADSVIANPNNRKQVFVGTHFGFYYTNDIDAQPVAWQRYQNNLPNTVIRYLTIDRGATTLAAFTYGRSLYTIKLPGANGFGAPLPAPANLAAQAISAQQIDLKWSDQSSNETGFLIERCAGAGCDNFAQIASAPADATSFSDTGLAAGTSYRYRVRATNGTSQSEYSTIASAATLAAIPPPQTPTSLAAQAISAHQIELQWNDQSDNETGFLIERCADAGCSNFTQVGATAANITSFSDTDLTAGTSYSYRVRATNGSSVSVYSELASATTFIFIAYIPLTMAP